MLWRETDCQRNSGQQMLGSSVTCKCVSSFCSFSGRFLLLGEGIGLDISSCQGRQSRGLPSPWQASLSKGQILAIRTILGFLESWIMPEDVWLVCLRHPALLQKAFRFSEGLVNQQVKSHLYLSCNLHSYCCTSEQGFSAQAEFHFL